MAATTQSHSRRRAIRISLFALFALLAGTPSFAFAALNPALPPSPVKLIFIHHSTGENWLADGNGDLGIALMHNAYFVSDTSYGWGPDAIGDITDIGHWDNWFLGPSRDTYMNALFNESAQATFFTRLAADPGGDNRIILFKSCFPNANISGNPHDPPTLGDNPLRGQEAWSEHMTVANVKGIYADLLSYFAAHQEKLFVLIASPPLAAGETDPARAANARAVTTWLVNDWLDSYPYHNVAVFDFYNVLTSNGGDPNTNDAGATAGNQHLRLSERGRRQPPHRRGQPEGRHRVCAAAQHLVPLLAGHRLLSGRKAPGAEAEESLLALSPALRLPLTGSPLDRPRPLALQSN